MGTHHKVLQGEHLAKIANAHGFADFRSIWNDPKNADLKKKRTPHILLPGDQIYIPDRKAEERDKPTENKHRFKVHAPTLRLKLVLRDLANKPVANTECKLEIEGSVYELKTDDKGKISQDIPATAEQGAISFKPPGGREELKIPVRIGHLDPIDTPTGWQARLNNMGYDAGKGGSDDERKLRMAIEEFQCDHKLKVDGICGSKTQARLKEVHGS